MNHKQRKIGALLSYLLTVVNALVGFIYIPILIFFLGDNEYGIYQLIGSILIYLSLFDFGLSNTVVRFYSKTIASSNTRDSENLLAHSFAIYFILSLLVVILGTTFYFNFQDIFNESFSPSDIILAKKMLIVVIFSSSLIIASATFNAIIQANEKFIFLRILSMLQTISRPIIALLIFTIETNALLLIISEALVIFTLILLKIYYALKKLKTKIRFHYFDLNLLKSMFTYSFFIFLTAIMDQILWRSDLITLGIINGAESVAVYSIALQIIIIYMTLSTAITGVFLPHITKLVANQIVDSDLSAIFVKVGRIQFFILSLILSGFILFGESFIYFWVGPDYNQVYLIIIIILTPFTIELIQNIGLTILQAKNLVSFRAIIFLCMSIGKVIVSIPLINYFGAIGAAISTSIVYLLGNGFIMNYYYKKKVGLDIILFWKEIFKISLALVPISIIGILLNFLLVNETIYFLLIKIILYSAGFIMIIWKFSMNSYEKQLISKMLTK